MPRFFNPPERIRTIGRLVRPSSYEDMISHLRPAEVLFAVYENTVIARESGAPLGEPYSFLVAVHVNSAVSLLDIREDVSVEYYAVDMPEANTGMDEPIPDANCHDLSRKGTTE